ncbi:MAG: sensor histidine kinase [Blastocatellia bacterium]
MKRQKPEIKSSEEQRRYIDQQQRVGRLHYLARLSPILAHEIKNPLNLISADLHLLRDQPVNEYSRELLREMERSVKEIDKLIVSIQSAVREESEANLQSSIQLAEVVRRIKARTEKRFPDLTLEIGGTPSKLRLKTAEEKLYVIFTNLIDNAAYASHGKGKVALNFTTNNGHLLVSIEDNGPGIPSDLKPVLFKPMHKGRNHKGTGMGLSIVKMFVTEEGGTITYDDSFTSGTRFLIELPVEQLIQG